MVYTPSVEQAVQCLPRVSLIRSVGSMPSRSLILEQLMSSGLPLRNVGAIFAGPHRGCGGGNSLGAIIGLTSSKGVVKVGPAASTAAQTSVEGVAVAIRDGCHVRADIPSVGCPSSSGHTSPFEDWSRFFRL